MSFFLTALKAVLPARLTRPQTWLMLLLLPLAVLGTKALLPPQEAAAPVQVGVVLPARGGEGFWGKLEEHSGLAVSFLLSDAGEAQRQVALGRWDCALVLPDDFEARLEALDTYQLMDLLVGPGSTAYPLVRETAAACVAQLVSPAVAERYLLDSGIADQDSIAALRPRLQEVLLDQDRVLVSMETVDGRPLGPLTLADSGMDSLLGGLLAIVLLVYALFAAMDLGRWLDSPFARRLLPLRSPLALLLPRLACALLPALCAGTLALAALERPLWGLWALLPYLLFLGAAALALARCRPLWTALPVLMPFVPAAGLLLSPVLLDLSLLFPALAPLVRWAPVTLFLGASQGRWMDGLALGLTGGALLALLWALERLGSIRSRRA